MLFAVKKAVVNYHIDRDGLAGFSLESDLHPKGMQIILKQGVKLTNNDLVSFCKGASQICTCVCIKAYVGGGCWICVIRMHGGGGAINNAAAPSYIPAREFSAVYCRTLLRVCGLNSVVTFCSLLSICGLNITSPWGSMPPDVVVVGGAALCGPWGQKEESVCVFCEKQTESGKAFWCGASLCKRHGPTGHRSLDYDVGTMAGLLVWDRWDQLSFVHHDDFVLRGYQIKLTFNDSWHGFMLFSHKYWHDTPFLGRWLMVL